MPTFALVTEGLTDQIIIENILFGFFDDPDIDITFLRPLRDETDRNRTVTPSNWYEVLEYCSSEEFRGAFQFNQYIIVQIDTDVSEDYKISKRDQDGNELSCEQLILQVRALMIERISQSFYEAYESRILFAIAVHSIECWLLPLRFTDDKKAKTVNCLGTLNQALQRKDQFSIDPNKKLPDYYRLVSDEYSKRRKLMQLYTSNPSLEAFVHELEKTITAIEDDNSADAEAV